MWVDAQLNWNDFLPEDQDMNKFVTEQVSSHTVGNRLSSIQKKKKKPTPNTKLDLLQIPMLHILHTFTLFVDLADLKSVATVTYCLLL